MGTILASKCRTCGFSNEFRLGGGKYNYLTICAVPVIHKATLAFDNVNYYECKDSDTYLFYSDAVLKGENPNDRTISNFNLIFNEEGNYCPGCHQKSLAFRVTKYFD